MATVTAELLSRAFDLVLSLLASTRYVRCISYLDQVLEFEGPGNEDTPSSNDMPDMLDAGFSKRTGVD